MRVIAGQAKGMKLYSPRGRMVRPTSDMVRGAIFDKLGPVVVDARVLDLFCGSGAIGIEALSRGAAAAVFIDAERSCIELVRRNLEKTRFSGKAEVYRRDAGAVVREMSRRLQPFDLVFLDPPYSLPSIFMTSTLDAITSGVLSPDGTVVCEHSVRTEPVLPTKMVLSDRRIYSSTAVSFLVQRPS